MITMTRHNFFRIGGMIAALLCLQTPAFTGTVAHYTFDKDYTDSSGNRKDGMLVDTNVIGNSGIITAAGKWKFGGGALNLSTDRDFVSIPSRTFSSGTPYSIAFWAKKAGGDTGEAAVYDMVIGQRNTANFFVALNDTSSGLTGLRWRSSSSATNRQADFYTPNDTNWHHYVVTAGNVSNITCYLDGTRVGIESNKLTGFIYDTIGEAYTAGIDYDFNGLIDEVWIFSNTLNAAAVSNLFLYNDTIPMGPAADLLLHYPFNSDCRDSSSSSNNGTAQGGAKITAQVLQVPVGAGALSLDVRDTSCVTLTSAITFATNDAWTVAFWAQRSELGAERGMVIGERNTTASFIWLNDSFTGLRFRSASAQTFDFTAAQDLKRHHYALTADGAGHLTLYRDGVAGSPMTGNTSFRVDTIGQAYTTNTYHYGFAGILDEIYVYGSALAGSEVAALRDQQGSTTPARLRVFLQGGQSNSDGRGDGADLPTVPVNLQQPQNDVLYWNRSAPIIALKPNITFNGTTNLFGPEVTFGRTLAERYASEPGTIIAILKYAVGGTSLLTDWKAGGDGTTTGDGVQYAAFQSSITNGLATLAADYPGIPILICGMTWMQGESDANSWSAGSYSNNLTNFIEDFRMTFGSDIPFVIGRLSTMQTALTNTYLPVIRSAQETVVATVSNTALVDTDSYSVKTDNLHFDANGQQLLGKDFALQTETLAITPPVAMDDSATTTAGAGITVDVLANDSDKDGGELAISLFTQGACGSVDNDGGGILSYSPADGFVSGKDSFTYTISDGLGNSDSATVNVALVTPGSGPVWTNLIVDTEAVIRGGVYAVSNQNEAAAGSIMVKYSSPQLDYSRKAYFQFDLSGLNTILTTQATFIVNFTAGNKQRVQLWGLDQAYPEFNSEITWNSARANETNSNNLLTGGAYTATAIGSSVIVPTSGTAACSFTIPSPEDYSFGNHVTLVLSAVDDPSNNAGGLQVTRTNAILRLYTLTGPSNTPPTAASDRYATSEDAAMSIPTPGVLTNDVDAEANQLIAVLIDPPIHGSLAFTNNGGFAYTPTTGYFGPDTFTYRASDLLANSGIATVSVAVTAGAYRTNLVTAITPRTDGNFTVGFSGVSGEEYEIQVSTNLASTNWLNLGTNIAGPDGFWFFTDSFATNYPIRFYRSVVP